MERRLFIVSCLIPHPTEVLWRFRSQVTRDASLKWSSAVTDWQVFKAEGEEAVSVERGNVLFPVWKQSKWFGSCVIILCFHQTCCFVSTQPSLLVKLWGYDSIAAYRLGVSLNFRRHLVNPHLAGRLAEPLKVNDRLGVSSFRLCSSLSLRTH